MKIGQAFQFIKEYLGELMIVLGVGIFTYNVFNFSSQGGRGGKWIEGNDAFSGLNLPRPGRYEFEYVSYYYPDDTLWYIAFGAMLIVGGILIMRRRSKAS